MLKHGFDMYNVFLSAPGDLEREREACRNAISEVNDTEAMPSKILLVTVGLMSDAHAGDYRSAVPENIRQCITMSAPETVTANFTEPSTSLTSYLTSKTGTLAARDWILLVGNNGPGAANNTQITGLKLTQTSGKTCSPVITTMQPILVGNLAPSKSTSATVTINFSSCAQTVRFKFTGTVTANNGAATGSILVTGQEP